MEETEFVDAETLNEFVAESLEHLSRFENQLLDVEADGAGRDQEVVNALFRAVHSIKGGGGLLGLVPITRLAHQMESVLGRVRDRELVLTAPDVDLLLQATDTLRSMLGHVESCAAYDLSTLGPALQRLADAPPEASRVAEPSVPTVEETLTAPAPPAPQPAPEFPVSPVAVPQREPDAASLVVT